MSLLKIRIRLADLSDAPAMAEIHTRSWESAYRDIMPFEYIKKQSKKRPEMWRSILSRENNTQYIIEADEKPAGMLCVGEPQHENIELYYDSGVDGSFYELHGIYLHPDYYRRGIGTKALNFALDKGRAAGKSNMILWVFAENTGSVRFYESCGFTADGAYKFYNFGKEMKAVRMRKEI